MILTNTNSYTWNWYNVMSNDPSLKKEKKKKRNEETAIEWERHLQYIYPQRRIYQNVYQNPTNHKQADDPMEKIAEDLKQALRNREYSYGQ